MIEIQCPVCQAKHQIADQEITLTCNHCKSVLRRDPATDAVTVLQEGATVGQHRENETPVAAA